VAVVAQALSKDFIFMTKRVLNASYDGSPALKIIDISMKNTTGYFFAFLT